MSTQTNYSTRVPGLIAQETSFTSSLKGLCLSARQLLVVMFFLLIFACAARPITDPDFWWHLKTGQYLVESRSIPATDMFSTFHTGKEWVTHEWLSQLFIYGAYELVGFGGLIVLFAGIVTGAFLISYRRFRHLVPHPYVAGLALLLGAFATLPTWGVRPQMFSLLLASVFLLILDRFSRTGGRRGLYWLVPLTVVWVNLHGGFALGLGLILLTVVGLGLEGGMVLGWSVKTIWNRVRPLVAIWVACLFSVALNPNGVRIYSYPFETIKSRAMMKYIGEWWSPDFHLLMFQPLASLIFLTLVVLALSRKHKSLKDLLLLSVTGLAALRSGRNVGFFALVAIPMLAEHSWEWLRVQRWGKWLTEPEAREEGKTAALKIALNIILLVIAPVGFALSRVAVNGSKQGRVNYDSFPAAAVDFMMARDLPQPLYNEYGWGGYLIWRAYPQYKVYIDGRADVYGDRFLEEYLMIHGGQKNWRELFERNGIRTALVNPNSPIASLLRQEPGWQKLFEDPQAAIFTKR